MFWRDVDGLAKDFVELLFVEGGETRVFGGLRGVGGRVDHVLTKGRGEFDETRYLGDMHAGGGAVEVTPQAVAGGDDAIATQSPLFDAKLMVKRFKRLDDGWKFEHLEWRW